MFAIKCYGFPEYPFTHFREGYKTLKAAKKAAAQKLVEGWRIVEVLKRETLTEMQGVALPYWKVIETFKN